MVLCPHPPRARAVRAVRAGVWTLCGRARPPPVARSPQRRGRNESGRGPGRGRCRFSNRELRAPHPAGALLPHGDEVVLPEDVAGQEHVQQHGVPQR
eukprot:gene19751-biopygen20549